MAAPLYLPVFVLASILVTKTAARISLGRWPVPMRDDPKQLGIDVPYGITMMLLSFWMYSLLLFPLPWLIWGRRSCPWSGLVFAVSSIVIILLLLCDPTRTFEWLGD